MQDARMPIKNPTMDPEKFARQFALIKARDDGRASRARIATISTESGASRAKPAAKRDANQGTDE